MQAGKIFSAETWTLDSNIWTLIVAIIGAIMVFETTPWIALVPLGVFVVTLSSLARKENVSLEGQLRLSPVTIAGAAGTIYIAVSLLWSGDPRSTAISAVLLAILLLAVTHTAAIFRFCPRPWIEHIARALLVAWILALGFLLFELLTNDMFKKWLFWPFRALRWNGFALPGFDPSEGPVHIPPQAIKWNMAPLNYLLWPSLLILSAQNIPALVQRVLGAGLVGALLLTIYLSDHKTSLVALICAIAAFITALRYPKAVHRVLQAYWVIGFIVIIPLALWAYDKQLHLENRTSPTLAARLILWNYTAQHVGERPILGVGAAATRRIDNQREAVSKAPQPPGFQYALRTGPHAHNVFLQSWYELGLIGTAIFLACGLLVLNSLRRFPAATQPYVLATAATVLVTDAASFGLFEPWFMATFAFCCIITSLAVNEHERVNGR